MLRRLAPTVLALITALAPGRAARADGVSPRVVSLPGGPGSVDGLGASFEPSPQSGGASYGVAFRMPPAVGDLTPALGLGYAGGGGASEVGLGWRLGVPAVRRRTEGGVPRYDASDTFALSGLGGDGDLVDLGSGEHRVRFEGAFVRVRRRGEVWEVRERSGITHYFGEAPESREGAGDGRAARWMLTRTVDLWGHEVRYAYVRDAGRAYLADVRYGGGGAAEVRVALEYDARPDVLTSYQSGQAITLARRLAAVRITRGGAPVSTYRLRYAPGAGLSQLVTVEMTGADDVTALPPVRFEYGAADFSAARVVTLASPPGMGLLEPDNDLADIDGDGAADLLVTRAGRFTVYRNEAGARFAAPYEMDRAPSVSLAQPGVQLADMDGDAAVDLVAKVGVASDGFRFYPGGDARAFGTPRAFGHNPAFTFEDADVRLVDLDFDRRTDALITTPSGPYAAFNTGGDFTAPAPLPPVDARVALRLSDPAVRLADVNGDRLQDLVQLRRGALTYWPSRGRGAFDAPVALRDVPDVPDPTALQLADVTGDGLPDLVRVGVNVTEVWVLRADGAFTEAPVVIAGTPERRASTAVRFADMNGNGTTDIVWVDVTGEPASAWRYLDLVGDAGPGLLTAIDNGLGLRTSIRYRASAAYAADDARAGRAWTTRLPVGMPVVAEVSRDDGLGAVQTTRFAYHNGLFDGATREFRGFGAATRTDVGDASQPTLVTSLEFDLGLLDEARKGRLLRSARADERGGVFDRAETAYDVVTVAMGADGRTPVRWARSRRSDTTLIERGDAPVTLRSETDYDEFGNVVATREFGRLDRTGDERFTRRTYAVDAVEWLLDRLASEEVTDAAGVRVSARRVYYDGEPFVGLPLGRITRGEVSREQGWLGPGADDWIDQAAFARDADGNETELRDADGRRRVIAWDPVTRAFPQSETIPFADGRTLVWRLEHDARWGVATAVTMPNGARSEARYDALGRRIAMIEPGDTPERPTVRYGYVLGGPLSRVEVSEREVSGTDRARTTVTLVDGARRERARLVEYEGGGWLIERFSRPGARGLDTVVARPFAAPSLDAVTDIAMHEVAGTRLRYDALGRVVETELPDGARTRTEHLPLRERVFDANDLDPTSPQRDTPETREHDGLGALVERREASRDGDVVWRYRYDAAGRLMARVDPIGAVATYEYDGLGRRTVTRDPDGGVRRARYDGAGNVLAQTNARGQTVTWRFDEAGRPVAHDSDGDGRDDARWTHDRGCEQGAGHLCRLEESRMVTTLDYDARGRVVRTRWTVDGGREWSARDDYDALSRVVRHVFPDGSSVDYRFNVRGLLDTVGGIVTGTEYELDGAVRARRFANGVREAHQQDARGRATSVGYVGPAGQVYEDLTREYDAVGLVRALRDGRPGRTTADDRSETYEYDDREHLIAARGTYGSIRWTYDAAARMLSRRSDVPAFDLGVLTYPTQSTAPQPNGPRTAGRHTLEYDADGNVARLDGRALTWDARNLPVRVAVDAERTIESWYDAVGSRRIERVHGGAGGEHTRVVLSSFEEVRDGALVRMVRAGDEVLFVADARAAGEAGGVDEGRAGARACGAGPAGGATDAGAVGAVVALVALALARRARAAGGVRVPRRVVLVAVAAVGAMCTPEGGGRAVRIDEGVVVLRDLSGTTLAVVDVRGVRRESDVRAAGGLMRASDAPATPTMRRFAGSQPQAAAGLAFYGPRVLHVELGLWLSPASVTLDGGEEAPYVYCDGNAASRVDASGHSWMDFVDRASRVMEGVARGAEAVTRAGEFVAGMGIPGVSQVAGAGVAAVRGTQAVMGVGFDGRALTTEERVHAVYGAVAGVAGAAGAGRVVAAVGVVQGTHGAVSAVRRGDYAGAALSAGGALLAARGVRSPAPNVARNVASGSAGSLGRVQTRINLANNRTRFTPPRQNSGQPSAAGWEHVVRGHFDRPLANSRSIFTAAPERIRAILQRPDVVASPARAIDGGQFVRVVDAGATVGNTALKFGGGPTSWMEIYTDRAGNLITTYPVPAPR